MSPALKGREKAGSDVYALTAIDEACERHCVYGESRGERERYKTKNDKNAGRRSENI